MMATAFDAIDACLTDRQTAVSLHARIRRDPGPFRVGGNTAMITVQGPRSLPYVVLSAARQEPLPDSDDDKPPSPPVPPPPAAQPEAQPAGDGSVAGDTATAAHDKEDGAVSGDKFAGGTATVVPAPVAPSTKELEALRKAAAEEKRKAEESARKAAREKAACEATRRYIVGSLSSRSPNRVAFLTGLACGKWSVVLACPTALLPRPTPASPAPTTSRVMMAGGDFFSKPRVTNVPPASVPFSDSDDDGDESEASADGGDAENDEECRKLSELLDSLSNEEVLRGIREVPSDWTLFFWEVEVPKGPFVSPLTSASTAIGMHLAFFRLRCSFYDAGFSECPMDWLFLRAPVRGLTPEQWGFFLRRSQTLFPKTDRPDSLAVKPALLISPNPHKRFCFDLRPARTADGGVVYDCFVEKGYLFRGRNPDGTANDPSTAAGEGAAGTSTASGSPPPALRSNARRKWRKDVETRRKQLEAVKITVNRDFRGTLYRMREYHIKQKDGTWFDPSYIEFIAEMKETDSANRTAEGAPIEPMLPTDQREYTSEHGWCSLEEWKAAPPLLATENQEDDGDDDDNANTASPQSATQCKSGASTVNCFASADRQLEPLPPSAHNPPLTEDDYRTLLNSDAAHGAMQQDSSLQRRLAAQRIEFFVIELWDAETDEALAASYGFRVGRACHDCSMATFVRHRGGVGHLLSHAAADILQRAGVELWYWGAELPYMTQFRATARGFDIPITRFLPLWRNVAIKPPGPPLPDVIASLGSAAPMPPWRCRPPPPPCAAEPSDGASSESPEHLSASKTTSAGGARALDAHDDDDGDNDGSGAPRLPDDEPEPVIAFGARATCLLRQPAEHE